MTDAQSFIKGVRLGWCLIGLKLMDIAGKEWSDTSLGNSEPGMMYGQVITPGFMTVLEADGEVYVYYARTGAYLGLRTGVLASFIPSALSDRHRLSTTNRNTDAELLSPPPLRPSLPASRRTVAMVSRSGCRPSHNLPRWNSLITMTR